MNLRDDCTELMGHPDRNSCRNYTPNSILVFRLCYRSLVCLRVLETDKETKTSTSRFFTVFPAVVDTGHMNLGGRRGHRTDAPEGDLGCFHQL